MACKSCGRRRRATTPAAKANSTPTNDAKDFSQTPAVRATVKSVKGEYISLQTPLALITPTGGWVVRYTVKGIDYTTQDKSPHTVVAEIKKVYDHNRIEIDLDTVWAHANSQWVKNVTPQYQRVAPDELAKAFGSADETDTYPPQIWGAKGWGVLQILLAAEKFDADAFDAAIEMLKTLLADPYTGCEECLEHFNEALAKKPDREDKEALQKWVWSSMNRVRNLQKRETISFVKAKKLNGWK